MPNPFAIRDDGTLDLVLVCTQCGEEVRYLPPVQGDATGLHPVAWAEYDDESYDEFTAWAKEDAWADHVCDPRRI